MKENILREYGLSENEIKVYLASLSLGTARVNEISKNADILRTTTYEVLKSLVEKGLASYVVKSGVRCFEAADPKKLISTLEEKKKKVESILPELNVLKTTVLDKPSIEIYEGKEGIKTILEDIIDSKPSEILQINSAIIFEALRFYFPHWIEKRIRQRIFTRTLQEKKKLIVQLHKQGVFRYKQLRFLPKDFKINTSNTIYHNKVAILTMSKDEMLGILIENKEIVETYRSIFETLWKICR